MSKVGTGVKKYILIPEAYPLYAMARIFGPKTGPLSKPTPTPIPVIGELLRQTGKAKVTIYEVVPVEKEKITGKILKFSEPVRLTPENFALPYEEIVNGKADGAPAATAPVAPPVKTIIEPKDVKLADAGSVVETPKDVLEHNAAMTAEAAKAFAESEEGESTVTFNSQDINAVVKDAVKNASGDPDKGLPPTSAVVDGEVVVLDKAPAEPETQTVVVETNTDVTVPMTPEEKAVDMMEARASVNLESKEQVERADDSENVEESPEASRTETAGQPDDPWPGMTDEEREAYAKMSKSERKQARRDHREASKTE